MKSKFAIVLMLFLAVIALPTLSLAAKKKDNKEGNQVAQKENLQENRGGDKQLSGTTTATTTKNEDKKEGARQKIFRLAAGLEKNIARQIAQVKNIIARLTGSGSIVAKLDAAQVNTTAIRAKLTEASTLADKAQTELSVARAAIASSTSLSASTTVQILKARVTEVRKQLASAHSDVKLAIKKVQEARKLINQIPGIRMIEAGQATSTTATSTTATGTPATTTNSN
ncbi:MAG: hypothetical protein NTY66_01600 [Candidatus Vogelbacteria bacterium]|nr:hypothetical protein [Candidatus Vogelbacteria bacterium]